MKNPNESVESVEKRLPAKAILFAEGFLMSYLEAEDLQDFFIKECEKDNKQNFPLKNISFKEFTQRMFGSVDREGGVIKFSEDQSNGAISMYDWLTINGVDVEEEIVSIEIEVINDETEESAKDVAEVTA